MNPRERQLEALSFGNPDRIPLIPGYGRRSTLDTWRLQGLPSEVKDYTEYAYRLAGGTLPMEKNHVHFSINERMEPQFEEKVIERRKRSLVVQDWKGNICEISDEFSTEYLRHAIDFVTRRWIKCPVETRADWNDMMRRYDSRAEDRLPEKTEELVETLKDRTGFLEFRFSGPFWQVREWVGFEKLCMLFYDDPLFLDEMISFWCDHVSVLLERAFEIVTPDSVHLSEDMAYKGFSMVSPSMVRKHLLPVWKKWGEIIRRAGVPLYSMDSDGFIGELIPLWIEAGINVCDPIEVAAGNDIVQFRREFGRDMAYFGGVDKRAMAKGGAVLKAEIERIRPVVEDGGFIPSCDHGIPADVSWNDFVETTRLLAEICGWL